MAAMPPSEASAPGSTGKCRPLSCSARYLLSCRRVTPAWTVTSASSRLKRSTRFIRPRSIETPPRIASTPPSTAVPVPKGMIGTPYSAQALTICWISSLFSGKTTTSGGAVRWREISRPCSRRTCSSTDRRSVSSSRSCSISSAGTAVEGRSGMMDYFCEEKKPVARIPRRRISGPVHGRFC